MRSHNPKIFFTQDSYNKFSHFAQDDFITLLKKQQPHLTDSINRYQEELRTKPPSIPEPISSMMLETNEPDELEPVEIEPVQGTKTTLSLYLHFRTTQKNKERKEREKRKKGQKREKSQTRKRNCRRTSKKRK